MSIYVEHSVFEGLVAEAINDLPEPFRGKLSNVQIVAEDLPDPSTMRTLEVGSHHQVMGFYRGVPLTRRTQQYGLVLPDRISIYRIPIQARSRSLHQMRDIIRRVLRHEIAHHFGISDERLRHIGGY